MTTLEQVGRWIEKSRGALIRVEEYINTEGTVLKHAFPENADEAFIDYAFDGKIFAWLPVDARPHAFEIERVEDLGDEFLLHVPNSRFGYIKLRISPIWKPEQRAFVESWRKTKNDEAIRGGIAEVIRGAKVDAGKDFTPKGEKHTFRAAWIYAFVPKFNELRTVGVLVEGEGDLFARCWAEFATIEAGYSSRIQRVKDAGGSRSDAFDFWLDRANGQFEDFSAPFKVEARTIEEAASDTLATSKTRADLLA